VKRRVAKAWKGCRGLRHEIEAGGRVRSVTVDRTGDTFAVTVDGSVRQVDAVRVDAQTLSLIVGRRAGEPNLPADPTDRRPAGTAPAIVYDVAIVPERGAAGLVVRVGHVPVAVSLAGRRQGQSGHRPRAAGPVRIVAPMPGKIVRVLVREGDQVRARQPIVVVEAMKMENELRAERDGTVTEILVAEGRTVDSRALLVVIQ
jgi:biotin carboxyl carrier protein